MEKSNKDDWTIKIPSFCLENIFMKLLAVIESIPYKVLVAKSSWSLFPTTVVRS